MKIKLQENILPIDIAGMHFELDVDDLSLHQAVDDFMNMYRGNRLVTETFIADCKATINRLLGAGAYAKIFKKDDLKPYYVILQLAEALKDKLEQAATTDKMRERQENAEKEMRTMQEIMSSMEKFNSQMDYAGRKYGMKNHVANKKKSANNRYSK